MRSTELKSGFTLIELTLVLAIMAVTAAIALPRYGRSINRYRVELAARRIISDLAFARSYARHTSQSVTVQLATSTDRILIPGVSGLRVSGEDYQTQFGQSPYNVRLVNADFGGDETVIFNGYGVPDSGGSVLVQAGNISMSISLDANSGKATTP